MESCYGQRRRYPFSDARLQPFKKGCFHLALDTEAVVVPMAIRGVHHVLQARSWKINLGQPVEVQVGKPIDTSGMTREQLPELMAQVRSQMEELLGDGEARWRENCLRKPGVWQQTPEPPVIAPVRHWPEPH